MIGFSLVSNAFIRTEVTHILFHDFSRFRDAPEFTESRKIVIFRKIESARSVLSVPSIETVDFSIRNFDIVTEVLKTK